MLTRRDIRWEWRDDGVAPLTGGTGRKGRRLDGESETVDWGKCRQSKDMMVMLEPVRAAEASALGGGKFGNV
uniref:Uncharacterized protein n=1 Tax=Nymphaea colorata TaxID=210225 RepID=A0A5K0Z5L0_9MAGN